MTKQREGKMRAKGGKLFFSDGLAFIFPYLAIYLLFAATGWPTSVLKESFCGLHVVFLLLACGYFGLRLRRSGENEFLFWTALALLFLLPGAYLEFPSDPWEHFRRILMWQDFSTVRANGYWTKFAYFFDWSFLSFFPIETRRIGLSLISAFWQGVLAYQVYLFARRLGFDSAWSKVQCLATIFLFGTNVFSFRYYALSSTPLAYAAYFSCLKNFLDFLDSRQKRRLIKIALLLVVMVFNHIQEVLLLSISATVILATHLWPSWESARKRNLIRIAALSWIVSLLLSRWALRTPNSVLISHIRWDPAFLTRWGIFRIWGAHSQYIETLAIPGLLSLLVALLYRKKFRLLSALSLTPVALLLYPPFCLLLSAVTDGGNSYRVLYAWPPSFLLVATCREISMHHATARPLSRRPLIACLAFLLLLSLFPRYPFRGRLWFQLYRPPSSLSLEALDRTAIWIRDHRDYAPSCHVLGEPAVNFSLATHFGYAVAYRLHETNLSQSLSDVAQFKAYLRDYPVCAILLPSQPWNTGVPSKVGALSGHWSPHYLEETRATDAFRRNVESLMDRKWRRVLLPTGFWLYEPESSGFEKPSGT